MAKPPNEYQNTGSFAKLFRISMIMSLHLLYMGSVSEGVGLHSDLDQHITLFTVWF